MMCVFVCIFEAGHYALPPGWQWLFSIIHFFFFRDNESKAS